ncbi:MAG TPA: hypothetical protein PLY25_09690 [Bacteroidia bacterium]|nr:hypothetical protein [Bacteroidia bacterium]
MTRPELHALADIVMDAREKGIALSLINFNEDANIYDRDAVLTFDEWLSDYPTFSDFTQAVKEYIKTLETK